jgi:hypothetical protein
MQREFAIALCFSGTRVDRSRLIRVKDVEYALDQALVKESINTISSRIMRGVMGGLFKGR